MGKGCSGWYATMTLKGSWPSGSPIHTCPSTNGSRFGTGHTRSGSAVRSYLNASAEAILIFKSGFNGLWRVKVPNDNSVLKARIAR